MSANTVILRGIGFQHFQPVNNHFRKAGSLSHGCGRRIRPRSVRLQ
jgi:hypothetical protein